MSSGRGLQSQSKHDKRIKEIADHHSSRGSKVLADHIREHQRPPAISGQIPDLIVETWFEILLIEIETHDSINTSHAKNQHIAFSRWESMAFGRRYIREVV